MSGESKVCAKCGCRKELEMFHRQPSGPLGRHSWCKECANAAQRASRVRNHAPEAKRRWQIYTRYRLTEADVVQLLEKQGGVCGICGFQMRRQCIDHDHKTGVIRGLLCHPCNVALGHIERDGFLDAAVRYLARHRK